MGWYILLGIALSALIKTYKLDRKFWVILNRGGWLVIVLAALAGIFSPLCSCGILPIVVTLLESGSPLAPAMALLITSPIADPSAIMVNYGALGLSLTVAKVGGALFMGLLAGFTTNWLVKAGWLDEQPFSGGPRKGYCDAKVDPANPTKVPIDIQLADSKIPFFFARAKDTTLLVGKYILLALFIQGVIETYVPANWIFALAGGNGHMSIVYAALLGIPLPVERADGRADCKGPHTFWNGGRACRRVPYGRACNVNTCDGRALRDVQKKDFRSIYGREFHGSIIIGYIWQAIS